MLTGVAKIINDIIQREGGYCDKSADRGGPTKYGITLSTLTRWRKCTVTIDDVQMLTEAEATHIYLNEYVILPGFDKLKDLNLQELVVDAGVNHGVHEATVLLQRAVSVIEDGILGPQTLNLVNSLPEPFVWLRFMGYRLRFYAAIISHDGSQLEFAEGWLNRCINILAEHSAEMVLEAHGKTAESTACLDLAGQFALWSKVLHRGPTVQDAIAYFLRAGADCIAAAAKFKA